MAKKNSHGVGHLHKRGNFYYYRYMINGKLKDVSLKVTTEADAKEKIKTEYLPLLNAKSKEQIALHVAESRKLINGLILLNSKIHGNSTLIVHLGLIVPLERLKVINALLMIFFLTLKSLFLLSLIFLRSTKKWHKDTLNIYGVRGKFQSGLIMHI